MVGLRVRIWSALAVVACVWGGGAETFVFPPYGHSYGIRKATPKHLFMFFGPRTAFDDPQGVATAKMISRDDPKSDNDDDEVVVYGVNSGRHQLIYNTSMWALSMYGSAGKGKDQFRSPKGVACDSKGNVFVADWGNNRVVQLFNPEKKVGWVRSFNGAGGGDPGLIGPEQVALDETGRVYVSDPGNRRVVVFDTTGKVVARWGATPKRHFVDGPSALAVGDGTNRWSYFRDERLLFCADSGGTRLWKLGLDGSVLGRGKMPAGYRALYGCTDYYHNYWVTDKERGVIIKFDHNLDFISTFGSRGEGDNQFIEPRGIAMWKRYGQTFVTEKSGAQYYWIGTKNRTASLTATGGDSYRLTTDLTEYSFVTILRASGSDTVRYLRKKMIYPNTRNTVFSADASIIKPGLVIRVEPTYSSYTYNHWDAALTLRK